MLNTAFKRQVLIGFTITLVFALISAVTSCLSVVSTRKSDDWQEHTYKVIDHIQDIQVKILTSETAMRGFMITKDEHYLEPFNHNIGLILPAVDALQVLVQDNNHQLTQIDSLKYYARLKVATMSGNLQLSRNTVGFTETLLRNAEKGKVYIGEITNIINQLEAKERALLKKRTEESDKKTKRTIAIVILSSVTIFGLVLYLLALIRKTFDFQKRVEEQVKERNERLAQLSFDNDQTNRLMLGLKKVNDLMFGDQELDELASNILKEVCIYTNAGVGAMYLTEKWRLAFKAGYACTVTKENATVAFGEGLVGQVGLEQKIRLIEELPDGYIRISSALGTSTPKALMLVPIIYEQETIAVFELGFLSLPDDEIKAFLGSLSTSIAVSLNSAIARVVMRGLFDQLQKQQEELERQQEEMQTTNEELVFKSDQLQASEEELKIQQEELQQTNAELEEKALQLEERNLAVNQAKEAIVLKADELEASSRYKSEFLANMSHELRTPLNSILILARILKENKPFNLTQDQIKYAGVIQNAGTDLLNLINDILDLSKIESGKVELEMCTIKPSEISMNMELLFSEIARSKHITFNTSIGADLPATFLSDHGRVEQIVKNLLSNAFKFTPENGTIELKLEAALNSQEFYSANLKNNSEPKISISITDSGIGIPSEKQRLIFEAFQQADGSTSRRYGGTGLGLSISKELAALLGGEIHLSSWPGIGSKFTLYLPLTEQEGKSQEASSEIPDIIAEIPAAAFGKEEHIILIVEDDVIFAKLLENYAVQKGYKPVLAHDGESAFALARSFIPHAIVLDIFLPDTDGWTVLKRLKADPLTANIPVHMMSSGDNNPTRAAQEGAVGFLKKPVQRAELNEAFELLEHAQLKGFRTVLIIEDHELQSELVKAQLTSRGIEVSQAFDGQQAMVLLETNNFDCIILDINLPDMSGLELLDNIKSRPGMAHIPVVINTAMELDQEKMTQIMKYSDAMVLKSNKSNERLMDEVSLFINKLQHEKPEPTPNPVPPVRTTATNQEKVLQGKSILITDDDMRNIFALSTALHEYNMQIVIANNGREALEKLDSDLHIDLILMDLMMPEMDGYEATRRIRKHEKHAKTPIIALTAKAMKNDRQKCIDAGASDYISKPVDIDKLLSLMRVWLS